MNKVKREFYTDEQIDNNTKAATKIINGSNSKREALDEINKAGLAGRFWGSVCDIYDKLPD